MRALPQTRRARAVALNPVVVGAMFTAGGIALLSLQVCVMDALLYIKAVRSEVDGYFGKDTQIFKDFDYAAA